MFSRFQIRSENHAAGIVQASAEAVVKVVTGGWSAIDTGFEDASVRSGEEKSPDGPSGELDCHCAIGLVAS